MEKIIKNENYWLKSFENIDDETLAKFVESIENAEKLALDEVKEEYDLLIDELKSKPFNKNGIYKLLINWKSDYLNCLASEFYFVKKFSNGSIFHKLKGSVHHKVAKVALDLFNNYKKHPFYNRDTFIVEFCDEAYHCIKAEGLYKLANEFIFLINEDIEGTFKLPAIENFEVDMFSLFENQGKRLIGEINDVRDEKLKLESKLIDKKSKISTLKRNISSLQNKIDFKENHIKILNNENSKKDFTPVTQFNELYWGDNYPALKVLFDFLQKNNVLQENWSYFASQMSIQNLEPINLNTGILGKKEIGYLLEKIKPFFLSEYRNRKNRYLDVLNRKFYIDFKPIDLNFQKNYIRDYKNTNNWLKTKNEIDNLCHIIANRYN